MTREEAIKEIDWYRQLIEKRITLWGKGLSVEWHDRLVGNISDVAQRESLLELKEYDNGYYIGELNAKGQREGYGIYTLTNGKGWIMQAGFWQKDAPMGSHTIYDAAAPAAKRMLASVHFSGRSKKERGKIELSISPRGIDSRERKFRQWEGCRSIDNISSADGDCTQCPRSNFHHSHHRSALRLRLYAQQEVNPLENLALNKAEQSLGTSLRLLDKAHMTRVF